MKTLLGCCLALAPALAPASEWAPWVPPADPNPKAILAEAGSDTKDGRYDLALDKHVWLFQHATQFDPSFAQVRLTKLLASWYRLGRDYREALNTMERLRVETGAQLRGAVPDWRNFEDFAAMTRQLDDDESATAELFEWLDEHQPDIARQAYDFAQRALIAGRKTALCAKYTRGPLHPIPAHSLAGVTAAR